MKHPLPPFDRGLLEVEDGSRIYWEVSGRPKGRPALYLHGGPGTGLRSGNYRHYFDPQEYCIVGIDQRGCGRSRPLATNGLRELTQNTTQALISDIEAVRQHLRIDTWLVAGMSWGTTLGLAYALAHPGRVSELVLVAVTTTSQSEVEWITEGMATIFPEAWHQFEERSGRHDGERIVDAYARRLQSADLRDRISAARAWIDWESKHISLDPNWAPIDRHFDEEEDVTFATLVTYYWSNHGFLPGKEAILQRASAISHIPAVFIHGRRDISGPAITAWRLNQLWPKSRLCIVETEGHGGPRSIELMRIAIDQFVKNL